MKRFRHYACILVLTGAAVGVVFAKDNFVSIPTDDPDMAVAKQKARETLFYFLTLAKAPRSNMERFAIKIRLQEGDQNEFFWIHPFEQNDGVFSGVVSSKPRFVRNVVHGQHITFTEAEIADWLYVENGRMKGNFTACAVIKHESEAQQEAFKKRHALNCDF